MLDEELLLELEASPDEELELDDELEPDEEPVPLEDELLEACSPEELLDELDEEASPDDELELEELSSTPPPPHAANKAVNRTTPIPRVLAVQARLSPINQPPMYAAQIALMKQFIIPNRNIKKQNPIRSEL